MEPQKLIRQNWEAAETEARKVVSIRTDLGWAMDIAGWGAERRGDFSKAIEYYTLGLQASVFTDDSIQFRSQWFSEGYGKFAAARLAELREHLPQAILDDPYFRLFDKNEPQKLRPRVSQYWSEKADLAHQQSRHVEAYRCYYNAGWDLGLQQIESYAKILDGLIISAENAESASWAALARLHRAFL